MKTDGYNMISLVRLTYYVDVCNDMCQADLKSILDYVEKVSSVVKSHNNYTIYSAFLKEIEPPKIGSFGIFFLLDVIKKENSKIYQRIIEEFPVLNVVEFLNEWDNIHENIELARTQAIYLKYTFVRISEICVTDVKSWDMKKEILNSITLF